MPRRDFTGNAKPTTITGSINATDLTIPIADATGWPSGGGSGKFYITIDRGESSEERVLVQSRTGLNLTVAGTGDRGVDDTTATTHSSGASIEHTFSAVDADEANAHVFDVARDDHTQYLNTARHDLEARHQFGGALGTPDAAADIGTAAAAGTGDDPAREDHVHKIGTGAINSSGMFAADVVNAAAIAANAVGASEIATGAVGATEIADNAVGTNHLFVESVVEAKIGPGAVTTSKIADASVTRAKRAAEAWTSYTPTVAQGGASNISKTVHYAKYEQVGKTVRVQVYVVITGGGSADNPITVTLPVAAAASGAVTWLTIGNGYVWNNSGPLSHGTHAILNTTTTVAFFTTISLIGTTASGFGEALANNDAISFTVQYEAA